MGRYGLFPPESPLARGSGVKTKGLSRSRLSDCNMFLLPCSCLPSCGGYALHSATLTKRSGNDNRRGNDGSYRNTHVHYHLCLGSACLHIPGEPRQCRCCLFRKVHDCTCSICDLCRLNS